MPQLQEMLVMMLNVSVNETCTGENHYKTLVIFVHLDLTIQGPLPGQGGKRALVIRLKCLLILQIFGGHIICTNPFCGATDTPVLVNCGDICPGF